MTDTPPLLPNVTANVTGNYVPYTVPDYWSNGIYNVLSANTGEAASQTVTIPFTLGPSQQLQLWVGTNSGAANGTAWVQNNGTASITMPQWVPSTDRFIWQPANGTTWPPSPPPIPKEAEIQAKELLKEFIGEEGLKVLENGGVIRVGGEYEIDHLGNCYKLLPDGGKKRFCIIPDESMAWGDVLVNKIVPLICNPQECERAANWKFQN